MQMLPRTRPENLDDLTIQVAIVRPGPIQGGAVHPYIERRQRLREDPAYEVPYEHPVARAGPARHARHDHLPGPGDRGRDGVRRLLRRGGRGAAAGDEPQALGGGARGPPPALRRGRGRALGRRRRGARRAGLRDDRGLLRLRLPEGARAAFGLLAYQSTWLRVHYGPEFLCALLNEQPMGFYPPDALVHEAQRRGIERAAAGRQRQRRRLPSSRRTGAVRIGLGHVLGVQAAEVEALVAERERGGAVPLAGGPGLARRSRAARAGAARLVGRAPTGSPPGRATAATPGARRSGAWASPRRPCPKGRHGHPALAGARPARGARARPAAATGTRCSPTTRRPG